MIYLALAFSLRKEYSWKWWQTFIILVAAIVPFGTFYVDKKYFRK